MSTFTSYLLNVHNCACHVCSALQMNLEGTQIMSTFISCLLDVQNVQHSVSLRLAQQQGTARYAHAAISLHRQGCRYGAQDASK
jgi:hypothetical protein